MAPIAPHRSAPRHRSPVRSRRRWRPWTAAVVLGLTALQVPPATAVEVPPTGAVFTIQTNGPDAAVGLGDFYTAADAGAGYHYVEFSVPCSWPDSEPVSIDLFSPEINVEAAALTTTEEATAPYSDTEFELYGPGVVSGPGPADPGPGAGTVNTVYPPRTTGAEEWVRFATLDPATCGTYTLRAETTGDDQNGWRLRVGADTDDDIDTPPVDDLDGVPGTDDEISLGIVQTSYQQDSGARACFALYEFIEPGTPSIAINNFDYDGADIPGSNITYTDPSGDEFPGTTSAPSATWNGSDAITRGGDVINDPEPGWWLLNSCVSNHNQFIQEGTAERPAYYVQPPTPDLAVTKDDGETIVGPGDALTYQIDITNEATGSTAGAARSVVATDTLAQGTTFAACRIVAPASGTCTHAAGVVTATLDGVLVAGASAQLEIDVTVDATGLPVPPDELTNTVSVAFEDSIGNTFQPVTATDADVTGTGSIGDTMYLDLDGDGTQEPGEPGLGGVPVTVVSGGPDGVLETADDVRLELTTAADGTYLLEGLEPGPYRVEIESASAPPGSTPTQGAAGYDVDLADGQAYLEADFGFVGTAAIGDTVYRDLDGDGTQDPDEPGVPDVDVVVTGPGPDGAPGTADDLEITVTTGSDGSYLVPGLLPGEYAVSVPAAPTGTSPTQGSTGYDVTLADGQQFLDADFGFAGPGSIGDLVWLDLDGDGTQDSGEPGLAGVEVTVTGPGPDGVAGTTDDVNVTVTTGPDGSYVVEDLPPGEYLVDVDVDASGAPEGTALVSGTDPVAVTLGDGEAFVDADFGFAGTGSIGDTVYLDLDGDGVQGPDEPALPGIEVVVTGPGQDGVAGTEDDVEVTVTTGPEGSYLVGGLPPGEYSVSVGTLPPGTTPGQGADGYDVTLAAGQAFLDADFGAVGSGSIGDLVWLDADGDGTQDDGEAGLPGVDVVLTWAGPDGVAGSDDDLVLVVTTDQDGRYEAGNLPLGDYTVAVDDGTLPAGVTLVGGEPTRAVTLDEQAPSRQDVDFGYQGTSDIEVSKRLLDVLQDGEDVRWRITVTNVGGGPTSGPIVVTDELEDALIPVSATGDGFACTIDGQVVTCEREPALEPGAAAVITVVTEIAAGTGTTISNTVTAVLDGVEFNPDNNTGTDDGVVAPADAAAPLPPDTDPVLPVTGAEIALGGLVAMLLIGTGTALVLGGRRRSGT